MKIVYTSKFILKSLLGERATGLFLVLASIFLVLSLSLSDINIAVKYRLLEDALLASEGFIMLLAAVFYPFLLMEKDRKGGLFVFTLLGYKREKYLLSLFLALFCLLFGIFVVFFVFDFLFLSAFADGMKTEFATKLFLGSFCASLLSFAVLTLARYVSNTNAIIYAIFLFFIGSGADELMLYAKEGGTILQAVSYFIYYALPNFSFFDPLSTDTHGNKLSFAIFYFMIYGALLYFAAYVRFKKEALKVG
ncbi:MAG TPA: hypothetical protein PKW30_03890 [Campylobacterales bacterium]|nr:hypothetical protein [Campylobacterales bacterium]